MKSFLSSIIAVLGLALSVFGTQACFGFILDEDDTPRSLIK